MKTLELFCGTKSFSKVATARGHSIFTIDNEEKFAPDLIADVRSNEIDWTAFRPLDVLWASPPCQGFSVAAIGRNWNKDYTPKTESAKLSMELVARTLMILTFTQPRWYFIENPRAMLRKLSHFADLRRVTVTYCQYGDTRQKPTDIWTNVSPEIWTPRPICRPGATCHEAAPRGSRTGTQGMKDATARGAIPPALFEEIFTCLEKV